MKILKFRLMEATPGTDGSTSSPSTPASSATTTTSEVSNNESSGGDFDFASLAMDTGDGGGGEAPAVTVTTPAATTTPTSGGAATQPTAAAPVVPATTPAPQVVAPGATPAAATTTAAAPPVQPAAPAATTGQAPGQSPAPASQAAPQTTGAPTPESIAQTFAQHREKFIPQLQQLYAFDATRDAAAIEELRTAPEVALPKLAANLHYEVQLATYNSVMQAMPEIIGQIIDRRKQVDDLAGEFKTMWPTLHEKPEYEKVAEESIRAVRTVNPKMPMTEVLQRAGTLALLTLGLPIPAPAGAAPATPAAPAAPVVRVPPPGRPAGVGSVGGSPLQNPNSGDESTIWAEMVDDQLKGIT